MTLEIPQSWREVLSRVQETCPSAVIAGGALRDLDNGLPAKDLDIFIQVDGMGAAHAACDNFRLAGYEVRPEVHQGNAYAEDKYVEVVYVAALDVPASGIPVQLIFTRWDTRRITDRIDYGICRLSFDGTTLTRTAEYEEDKAAKVFRLRRYDQSDTGVRRSQHRYDRLSKEKYPGWSWAPFTASPVTA